MKHRLYAPVFLGLLATLGTCAVARVEFFRVANLQLVDRFFVLRESTAASEVSPEIQLVLIDDDTYKRLAEPPVFWVQHYTTVISGLLDSGAKVVALDGVPSYADERSCVAFNQIVSKYPDRVVLGYYLRERKGKAPIEAWPPEGMLPMLRANGLGRLNLAHDEDGVCRRMPVLPFPLPDRSSAGLFFAPRIAELFLNTQIDPQNQTFNNAQLPLNAPDQTLWINYHGRPGRAFQSQPFHELLAELKHGGKGLQSNYRGKIVLIGFAADADQDRIETPLRALRKADEQGTRGVEVHAQFLSTLIQGDYLKTVWFPFQFFVTCAASILVAAVTLRASLELAQGAGLFLVVSSLVGSYSLFSYGGVIVAPLEIAVSLGTAWGASLGWRLWTERKERRHLEGLFGRYVAPQVMKVLLEQRPETKPQKRMVTVMYCDINDFSQTCKAKSPEKVAEMLDVHFQEVTNIIFEHGGTILRFIGDQFMVIFGAPSDIPNPETTAVRTAIAIIKGLRRQKARALSERKEGFFEVKVGIHAGELILTSIGKEKRSDYIAIGDTANTAARVQDRAKTLAASGILVSHVVAAAVLGATDIELKPAGRIPIKGSEEELEVFEVVVRDA